MWWEQGTPWVRLSFAGLIQLSTDLELGPGKLPGTNSVVWIYATASPCVWRAGNYEVTIEIGIEVEIDSETEYRT